MSNLISYRLFSFVANGFESTVEHHSGTSGHTDLACGGKRGDVPATACIDQQRSPAHAVRSRAVVPQQLMAACIDRMCDDATSSIRHEKERVILLIATEHDLSPVLRQIT
jgi:hypothetical protein